ncbi:MAG: hypothetical protein ACKO8I_16730 [Cyanobacteriota bacterium]
MLKLLLPATLPLLAASPAGKTMQAPTIPEDLGLAMLLAAVLLVILRARAILELLDRHNDPKKPKALNWPTALRSLSGGLAAAYVLMLLIPEFSTITAELHGPPQAAYALALIGLLIFKGIQHFCLQQANAAHAAMGEWKFVGVKAAEKRSNFAINLGVFTGYTALILLTLPFQFSHLSGLISSSLYLATFALHLGFDALAICEEDKNRFSKLSPKLVLPALVLTSLLAAAGSVPDTVLLGAFSLLGGIVIYNVFSIELRKPEDTSFVWFLAGAVLFTMLNSLRLQAGAH